MIRVKAKQTHVTHLRRSTFAEAFGWCGSIGILVAYALLSLGIVSSNSVIYHLLFLFGSAALATVTYRHKAYQSFTVNIFFVVLAAIALFRLTFLA